MRPESDVDHYPCTYSLRQIFVQILGLASKTLNCEHSLRFSKSGLRTVFCDKIVLRTAIRRFYYLERILR